jgi:outer membrane protein OmpA-like peptidoglycan-associated protein
MTSLRTIRRTVRGLAFAALAGSACLAFAPEPARADTSLAVGNGDGINTRLFRAAVDSKGFFTVNGTDVLGAGDFAFGLVLDGGFGLLRLRETDPNGTRRNVDQLINSQFHGHLFASYSPIHNLTVGLGIPVDLVAGDPPGPAGTEPPGTARPGRQTNVNAFFGGNWQINLKYRILRVEDAPIGMAVIVQADIPAGEAARRGYAADPGPTFTPLLAFEKRFGAAQRFRLGLNVGASIVTGDGSQIGDLRAGDIGRSLKHGNLARAGFGASYRITEDLDLVAETYGSHLLKNDAGGTAGSSAEVVGGIKVFVERNSYLFLGGGVGYLKGYQAANQRAFLGFIFEPSIGDRDGDGIKDDVDKCPDDPEDRDGFQDEDGCPDPDNDQDGILDKNDACPNDPETKNGIADEDGCPDGIDGDRDKDGIPDSRDKCPDVPEDKDGFQDEDGCPDPDNDNDGILDKDDQCPNEPEDRDGFEDKDGCPDPDNDHDGILDKDDKCPNEPETYNGFEDEDGCPDKGRVIIDGSSLVILDKIQFDYNSAAIKKESLPIVDAVAATLRGHPEFTLVEIQGHADERGNDDYNLRLTQERVNSVMKALQQRGIESKRLRAMGYGEYCPLDQGHTEAAWEKNRRVEFKIVKTKDGPTGVVLGCPYAEQKGVKSPPVP